MFKKLCGTVAAMVLLPVAFAAAYDDEDSAGNDYWRAAEPRRMSQGASDEGLPADQWRPRQTGRAPRSTAPSASKSGPASASKSRPGASPASASGKRSPAGGPEVRQAAADEDTPMMASKASMQMDAPPPPPPASMQNTPMPATENWENAPPGPPQNGVGPGAPSNGYDFAPPANREFGQMVDDGLYDEGGMGCGADGCGCGFGGCGGCCGYGGRVYASAEYLAWWVKGDSVPALVTTSPAGTARVDAGVLGQAGTSVLYGNDTLNNTARSGARVKLGMWLTSSTRLEGEWFGLGEQTSAFTGSSDGTMILARPFYNLSPTVTAQDSNVISYPGQLQGTVNVNDVSRFMGAGLTLSRILTYSNFGRLQRRVNVLYGFRYLRLYDSLSINDAINSIDTSGIVPVGTIYTSSDSFTTSNQFYGLNLGVMSENRINRWQFTSIGRLAIGGTQERVTISGTSTSAVPGGASTSSPGGLLAQPSNIGTYTHSGFALAPQLELKLQYDLTPNLTLSFGYDLLYWSRVVRPGAQVSTYVNTTQSSGGTLTGVPGPLYTMKETDLWVQGISAGGQWRF